jgi:prolyl 4-hydroxylase
VSGPAVTFPLAGDRKLFWIESFLRPEKCASILDELRFAFWSPSAVTDYKPWREPRTMLTPMRVSETTSERWFTPELRRTMRSIDRRLESLVPHFQTRREEWQATRYGVGGKFDYHLDGGHWTSGRGGYREHSVVIYLNTPRRGGATHFRELDVQVEARTGRLLVWRNMLDRHERDLDMLHAATPLVAGRKIVLVTWVRQRKVRNQL